jgi:hypothetical protein
MALDATINDLPEMPQDTGMVRGGNGAGGFPKSGKVRLLSLDDLDRRTGAYRKTAELINAVEADCGGADQLSTAERAIIRRAALAGAMLEDLGARWLAGEPIDPGLFATLSNSERRLYESIGLRRRTRDVTPTLGDYLRAAAPLATAQEPPKPPSGTSPSDTSSTGASATKAKP